MTNAEQLELTFRRVEQAIDQHPRLQRVAGPLGEPEVVLSRLGVTFRIPVKLKGSGSRARHAIKGDGESIEEAAQHLIERLDLWAEALK